MTATELFSTARLIGRAAFRFARLFDPIRIIQAGIEGFLIVKRHWRLALALGRRDLTTKYTGQFVGSFWVVAHPVLQMIIFVFLFAVVFQQRIGGTFELPRDYTVYILTGLVAWLSILPVMLSSCSSIISNASLVKQFKFEIEVLPIKDVVVSLLYWVIGILIVSVYTLFLYRSFPWTYILLPILFLIHVTFLIGCAWLLSAVTVFFRDLQDILTVWSNLGVYLLPVVFLPQWVPGIFQPIIYSNPLSSFIWIHQDVLYFGRIEHPISWLVSVAFALFMFTTGHRVFQRLRPMFGNAL